MMGSRSWGRRHRGRIDAWILTFFVLGVVGCQSEVEPSAISATIVAYGEFEIEKGMPTLRSATDRIQCEAGRIFGADYRIDVADGQYGVVPVEFRWVHPELSVPSARLWGRETPARRPNPKLAWRKSSIAGRALWTFEHPEELVSGEYEFQIRTRDESKVLASQTFEVFGC